MGRHAARRSPNLPRFPRIQAGRPGTAGAWLSLCAGAAGLSSIRRQPLDARQLPAYKLGGLGHADALHHGRLEPWQVRAGRRGRNSDGPGLTRRFARRTKTRPHGAGNNAIILVERPNRNHLFLQRGQRSPKRNEPARASIARPFGPSKPPPGMASHGCPVLCENDTNRWLAFRILIVASLLAWRSEQ
jgi:hypothetical protein